MTRTMQDVLDDAMWMLEATDNLHLMPMGDIAWWAGRKREVIAAQRKAKALQLKEQESA